MISVKGTFTQNVEVEPIEFLYNLISSTGIDPLVVDNLKYDEEEKRYYYEVGDSSYHGSPIYKFYINVDERLVEFAKKTHEILIFVGKNKELFQSLKIH